MFLGFTRAPLCRAFSMVLMPVTINAAAIVSLLSVTESFSQTIICINIYILFFAWS